MKAIVSGAGIAGLSSAIALGRVGWQVMLVERATGLRDGGYAVDFFGPGYDAAADLGVLDALRARAHPVHWVRFVDAKGDVRSTLDYALMRKAADGKLFPILRGDIERVLYDALPKSAAMHFGVSVTAVEDSGDAVGVTLSDGNRVEADLLVGADGIHSSVRRLVFESSEISMKFLGFHTAAYFFESPTAMAALGGDFKLMTTDHRMAGFYGLEDGRVMAFFVMRANGPERPADPRAALRQAYGDLGWVLPEALAAAPDPADIYYDIVAQIDMPTWHRGRSVLVGDAGYAVSLLAGQGASLAMAGGRALGEALSNTDAIEPALALMEQRLRRPVEEKQRAGRRTADWFVPRTPIHSLIRDLGINAMNWPPLSSLARRFFSFSSKGFSLAARH